MTNTTNQAVRRALALTDLRLPPSCRGYLLTRAAVTPIEIHPSLLVLDAERWVEWARSLLLREASILDLLSDSDGAELLALAACDAEARMYGDEPSADPAILPALARRLEAPFLRGPEDLPMYARHLIGAAGKWDGHGDLAFVLACEQDLRGMLVTGGLAGARLHRLPWLKVSGADQRAMRSIIEDAQEDPEGWFDRTIAMVRKEGAR
jgi:hypothetical protein